MLGVEKSDTVDDVKSKILKEMGIPKDMQKLHHACLSLRDDEYCHTRVLVTEARYGLGMDMGVENEAKSWNPITLGRLLSRSIAISIYATNDYVSDVWEGNRSACQRRSSWLSGLNRKQTFVISSNSRSFSAIINAIRQRQMKVSSCWYLKLENCSVKPSAMSV